MIRALSFGIVLLLCVSCARGTPNNPLLPPGASPTKIPEAEYVGLGRYQKLAEITVAPTFGGVPFITFLEIRQAKESTTPHQDVPGFVYALQGPHQISRDDGERGRTLSQGDVGWVDAGSDHVNPTTKEAIWDFVSFRSITQRGQQLPYPSYRVLYQTGDLGTVPSGKQLVHQLGMITMDAGGRTSAHSHGGVEAFYVMKGTVQLAVNDGTRVKIAAGQGASIRPGAIMQLRVVGDEPVQILTYFVTPEGEPWQTNVQTLP